LACSPRQAVVVATGAFFNPVVLLFLSGFAMSRVMDTYEISRCVLALHATTPVSWLAGGRLLCGFFLFPPFFLVWMHVVTVRWGRALMA